MKVVSAGRVTDATRELAVGDSLQVKPNPAAPGNPRSPIFPVAPIGPISPFSPAYKRISVSNFS